MVEANKKKRLERAALVADLYQTTKMTYRELAQKFNVSDTTIEYWLDMVGTKRTRKHKKTNTNPAPNAHERGDLQTTIKT